ncbi:MAG TPA: amidohydrolase family protein [Acidimicrobiia bacterium]
MSDESAFPPEENENRPAKNGDEKTDEGGLSRRKFLAGAAAAGAAGVLGVPSIAGATGPSIAFQVNDLGDGSDLIFVNGRIHTMDGSGTVARSATIRNGRFVNVGTGARAQGPGTTTINLGGRTVIPGIIDNHNHIVLMGNRPGFHTPLENANSIAEVQETLAARAAGVPAGEFITTIGGFHINQFEEQRFPNLAELDEALPDHPVYISQSFAGPSATNSLGKSFFEAHGVAVGADGSIAGGFGDSPTGRATFALRQELLTPETRRRGAIDAMAYGAGLGVTTHLDQGAFQSVGNSSDGAASEDNYTMHIPFLELYRSGQLGTRLRINFLHRDTEASVPTLTERIKNQFPFFGGDMVKTGGIGEFIAQNVSSDPGSPFVAAARLIAEAGWRAEVHSLSSTDFQTEIQAWEFVNDNHADITDLRWVIAHVPLITEDYVDRLKALGGGLSLTGWRYLAGSGPAAGPPFRMIVDNGINVGMSSDGMQIAPMNPWLHMYYATTGINSSGNLINDGQQISREEVLRLYTADNAWFIGEDDLGSVEVGKHADLVVLSDDYFAVSDDEMKDLHSVLTVVGGRVVHDAGVL